jgi:hypothetical protein
VPEGRITLLSNTRRRIDRRRSPLILRVLGHVLYAC